MPKDRQRFLTKEFQRKFLQRFRLIHQRGPQLVMASFIGVAGGLAAILFHWSLHYAEVFVQGDWFGLRPFASGWGKIHDLLGMYGGWLFVLVPALGALISAVIIHNIAPEAAGDGTYATIDNFHNRKAKIRKRVPVVKWFASLFTIASGGSAGHEGPVAQIGAGIAGIVSRPFRMNRRSRRIMLLAGTAAGLGAIFKAPLGGALTSVEILYKEDFESDAFLTSIVASVIAFAVFTAYAGTSPVFRGVPVFEITTGWQLLPYALLGLACAPASWIYVKVFYGVKAWSERWTMPFIWKPMIGGLFVGLLWLVRPEVVGGGWYVLPEAMMEMQPTWRAGFMLLSIALGKMLATSLTVGTGAAGGIFGPSLVMGGALGGSVGAFLHLWMPTWVPHPETYVLVGMGAFFAGAANAPIAAVVMVCEMTGSYSLLAPLMLASVVHVALSRRWSIYSNQVTNKFQSPAHKSEMQIDVLMGVNVEDVIAKRPVAVLSPMADVAALDKAVEISDEEFFPVMEGDRLVGLLDLHALRKLLAEVRNTPGVIVNDLMNPPWHLRLDMNLHLALQSFLKHGVSQLPVLDRERRLCGMLSYEHIVKAYDQLVRTGRISRSV